MTKSKERIKEYSIMRVLAIIAVVVGHSTYLTIEIANGGVNYTLPTMLSPVYPSTIFVFWRFLSGWVYKFHMPAFFMLSGALFCANEENKNSFNDFIDKKFKRLIVPYYCYGLFFMLPVKYIADFYNKDNIIPAINSFLLGLGDGGHLWFLPALFGGMILLFGITKITNDKNSYLCLIIAGLVFILRDKLPIYFFYSSAILENLLWLSVGYCFEKHREGIALHENPTRCNLLFGLLGIVILFDAKYNIVPPFYISLIVTFWLYLLALMLGRCSKILNSRWFQIIEKNSMYIYLFHDPLEYIVLRFVFHFNWLESAWGCIAYVLLRTIGIYVFSLFLASGKEKIQNFYIIKKSKLIKAE